MVSGTGERTIASWAALTLIVGLALSAAPAANSATHEVGNSEPQTTLNASDPATQSTLDEPGAADESSEAEDAEDTGAPATGDVTSTGTPSPTKPTEPTNLDPSDPETTDPGAEDPGDPDDSESNEQESESDPDDSAEPPAPEFSCDGGLVAPGEVLETSCTVPNGFELSIPHPYSSTGGNAQVSGNSVIYTAPETVNGTVPDPFTVHASGPDETLEIQVTFTIRGSSNDAPTDEPTPDPEPPQSPSPTDTGPPTPSETAPPTNPPSNAGPPTETGLPSDAEPTSGAPSSALPPLPGGPEDPTTDASGSMLPFLPIPGMPAPSAENLTPEPSAEVGDEASEANESDDREGESDEDDDNSLAQTGPEQMAWAGSLAVTALVLGTVALSSSRRQAQRSSSR